MTLLAYILIFILGYFFGVSIAHGDWIITFLTGLDIVALTFYIMSRKAGRQ